MEPRALVHLFSGLGPWQPTVDACNVDQQQGHILDQQRGLAVEPAIDHPRDRSEDEHSETEHRHPRLDVEGNHERRSHGRDGSD
jgi:hypothetical protein